MLFTLHICRYRCPFSGSASFTFAFGQISPQKTQTVHVPGPCVASSKAQTQVGVYVSGQTLKKKISVTSSNQLQCAYFQVNMAKTDQLERLQNQKTVEGCQGWLYSPHTVQRAWMKGWAVTKLQPTCTCMLCHVWLCDPMDCCSPGSSVHGFFQARILEWDAGFQLQGSDWPRDWTHVSWVFCIGRQILYHCTTWEAPRSSLPSTIWALPWYNALHLSHLMKTSPLRRKSSLSAGPSVLSFYLIPLCWSFCFLFKGFFSFTC